MRITLRSLAVYGILLLGVTPKLVAGQAPGLSDAPDIPISSHDRVYTGDQTSNTVSVYDPSTNRLLGVIRLGDPAPQNLSPLYRGQLLVHGLGFSFDHGLTNLVPIGDSGLAAHLTMGPPGTTPGDAPTTVTVNNQGLIDLLQAAVTGLQPKTTYRLALAEHRSAPYGGLEPLVVFATNPAGAAIVDTLGPLRHFVSGPPDQSDRRYLVIVPAAASSESRPIQIQLD